MVVIERGLAIYETMSAADPLRGKICRKIVRPWGVDPWSQGYKWVVLTSRPN